MLVKGRFVIGSFYYVTLIRFSEAVHTMQRCGGEYLIWDEKSVAK